SSSYALPRRHPISTLFPYTTLFRSERGCRKDHRNRRRVRRSLGGERPGRLLEPVRAARVHDRQRLLQEGRPERRNVLSAEERGLDRKSTRLNSSHQIISYAVFCLKK